MEESDLAKQRSVLLHKHNMKYLAIEKPIFTGNDKADKKVELEEDLGEALPYETDYLGSLCYTHERTGKRRSRALQKLPIRVFW